MSGIINNFNKQYMNNKEVINTQPPEKHTPTFINDGNPTQSRFKKKCMKCLLLSIWIMG